MPVLPGGREEKDKLSKMFASQNARHHASVAKAVQQQARQVDTYTSSSQAKQHTYTIWGSLGDVWYRSRNFSYAILFYAIVIFMIVSSVRCCEVSL